MQKTIILSLALMLSTAGVFAQGAATSTTTQTKAPVSSAERAKKAVDKISALVQLSEAQSGKILPMLEDYYNNVFKVKKADNGQNSAETTTKMQGIKEGLFGKLKGVLSADQLAKVKEFYQKEQSK